MNADLTKIAEEYPLMTFYKRKSGEYTFKAYNTVRTSSIKGAGKTPNEAMIAALHTQKMMGIII